jgi:P2-related tail formation protein
MGIGKKEKWISSVQRARKCTHGQSTLAGGMIVTVVPLVSHRQAVMAETYHLDLQRTIDPIYGAGW